jgi:hypothetical protein
MTQPLNAVVRSCENGRTTVEFEDGQRLCFQNDTHEAPLSIGESIRILVTTSRGSQEVARHIVNELLGAPKEQEPHV